MEAGRPTRGRPGRPAPDPALTARLDRLHDLLQAAAVGLLQGEDGLAEAGQRAGESGEGVTDEERAEVGRLTARIVTGFLECPPPVRRLVFSRGLAAETAQAPDLPNPAAAQKALYDATFLGPGRAERRRDERARAQALREEQAAAARPMQTLRRPAPEVPDGSD